MDQQDPQFCFQRDCLVESIPMPLLAFGRLPLSLAFCVPSPPVSSTWPAVPSPEIVQRARGLETPVNSNRSGAVAGRIRGRSGARGESEAGGRNKAATRRLKKSRGV